MAFSTAGGGPSRPEMNVTPLIDILLVLIIVFMVIVATSKEYVVNTQLPEESKGGTTPSERKNNCDSSYLEPRAAGSIAENQQGKRGLG
jgi:biopolymer transport protein ExbD